VKTCITAAWLYTPLDAIEQPIITIEDGVIDSVESRAEAELPADARHLDYRALVIVPGYIDLHIHGSAGHDVMEGEPSALAAIQTFLARHGVTSYLPTTVTAPTDKTLTALEKLGRACALQNGNGAGARPLGIHLEGPFLSHAKRGVHPPDLLREGSLDLFDSMWQASQGRIHMMTIAPEIPNATALIRHATQRGVHCSLGHSDAGFTDALRAIDAGADHATHTFNAMRPLDHREPGILGAALSDDRLTADIIADGVHVEPAVVQTFVRAKGLERAILITDAISATGMPDGKYMLGSFEVEVKGDRCEFEGRLAGSVLTLERAVRNVMRFAGLNLQDAVRLATLNPAVRLDITGRAGLIAPGRRADLVLLTEKGEVARVFTGGELVE
jgi:N-acetylglucosamine-6-phosphate deacetylase